MAQRLVDLEFSIKKIERFKKLSVSQLDEAIEVYRAMKLYCQEQEDKRMREINSVTSDQL